MTDTLLQKLGKGLSAAGRAWLEDRISHPKTFKPRHELVREGNICDEAYFVLDGIVSRSKHLANGRRTILAFLLAGDFCALDPAVSVRMDHDITCETSCSIVSIPRGLLREMLAAHPRLAINIANNILLAGAIQRQWLANMGACSLKRTAHLFCELMTRMSGLGLVEEESFFLPLSQQELGEALGISSVHVNRTLQQLRDLRMVRTIDRMVIIANLAQLKAFAEFDESYLNTALPSAERPSVTGEARS
jgi:CRP-like cAMP-binding protein